MKKIVNQDMGRIYGALTDEERAKFSGSTVLLTGGLPRVLFHKFSDAL